MISSQTPLKCDPWLNKRTSLKKNVCVLNNRIKSINFYGYKKYNLIDCSSKVVYEKCIIYNY